MKKILFYTLICLTLLGIPGSHLLAQGAQQGTCIIIENGVEQKYINVTREACDRLVSNNPTTHRFKSWTANGVVGSSNPNEPYVFLAPLPCSGTEAEGCVDGKLQSFDPTKTNSLGKYLNVMLKILIGLCAVMAVAMIVAGGIEYMTSELVHTKEAGKNRISEAIFGLLLALGAYALLNTINPDLLKTDLESLESEIVLVDLEADVPQTAVNGKYRNGATHGNPWDDTVAARSALPNYVSVNTSECTTIGQRNCTSLRGLNMSKVQEIQYGCRCTLVITGGTESWLHGGRTGNTTHHVGSATVDLRRTPELDRYLSGGEPLQNFKRYGPNKEYLFEGDHWHIGR